MAIRFIIFIGLCLCPLHFGYNFPHVYGPNEGKSDENNLQIKVKDQIFLPSFIE